MVTCLYNERFIRYYDTHLYVLGWIVLADVLIVDFFLSHSHSSFSPYISHLASVFLIGHNADVISDSPIETLSQYSSPVTEAPVICAPVMNPLSKSLRSLPLDTTSRSTTPTQHFYTSHRALQDFNGLIISSDKPVWKHLHLTVCISV